MVGGDLEMFLVRDDTGPHSFFSIGSYLCCFLSKPHIAATLCFRWCVAKGLRAGSTHGCTWVFELGTWAEVELM